ncbi:MAG: prephenate dehydratase [Phycisphaerae bacterium]|nr:prephenate dehydratase [Phycisphaerae bacterium]
MTLEELRQKINGLDKEIVELLNQRAEVVIEIGKLKAKDGSPIYAPDREKEILERIRKTSRGSIPDRALVAIWRELMSASFSLEKPLRIAYLGPQGSNSHLAATVKFGASVEYESVSNIRGVFEEVGREHADFGVVPIENSTGGGVTDTIDAFVESRVRINAEINKAIHHNLLAKCGLDEIERVYSKPEVFAQCQHWLSETDLASKCIAAASTSKAAETAAQEPGSAALGSTLAAELYGLKVICDNVEDNPNNITRFFVIGRGEVGPTGSDKTALTFTTAHAPGALADVLQAFKECGTNLTFIESRPSRQRNWEYFFFAEAEGHISDTPVAYTIERARKHCLGLYVLGSFPKASEIV